VFSCTSFGFEDWLNTEEKKQANKQTKSRMPYIKVVKITPSLAESCRNRVVMNETIIHRIILSKIHISAAECVEER